MLGLSESKISRFVLILLNIFLASTSASESKTGVKGKGDFEDENYGVKYASKCEGKSVIEFKMFLVTNFRLSLGLNYITKYLQCAKLSRWRSNINSIRNSRASE